MAADKDSEAVVADMAARVKEAYCARRAMFCSGMFSAGPDYDKFWTKIAKLLIKNGIEPDEYMDVHFKRAMPYPYINRLGTDKGLKQFYDSRVHYAGNFASSVLVQMAALEKLMAIGRTPEEILNDPMQNFDALFSYVISSFYELDEERTHYFDEAIQMYLLHVNYYDAIYKDLIPQELKEATRKAGKYADS